jgi:hypothetical protein
MARPQVRRGRHPRPLLEPLRARQRLPVSRHLRLSEVNKSKGPFLTSLLGANFDPRGEVVPQG